MSQQSEPKILIPQIERDAHEEALRELEALRYALRRLARPDIVRTPEQVQAIAQAALRVDE